MTTGNAGLALTQDDPPPGRGRATAARLRLSALVFSADRRELLASIRRSFLRASGLASALFCLMFVAFMVLKPLRNLEVVRVVMPPTKKVMLKDVVPEPPKPADALKPERKQVSVEKVADPPVVKAPPVPIVPSPLPPRVQPPKPVDKVAAQTGRTRAAAATAGLAKATASLDRALGDLTSSLGAAGQGTYTPSRKARARNVGAGRSDGQLGAVGNGIAGSGASADLGARVEGSMVEIGSLAPARATESIAGAEGGVGTGSKPGVYRTNAQLLAVIQKYAAGIQYCYESELKRDPSLRGKLVVAMTVTPAGAVSEATVVQNTVGSARLASCALSQIRSWRFPAIDGGLTTFQAPFVFTPPK